MTSELERIISKHTVTTDLERWGGDTPPETRIWIKRECDHTHGSHYDRVYHALFHEYEQRGDLTPGSGQKVLETTSGSAGASFAGIGSERGYDCDVIMPPNVEEQREKAIEDRGGTIIYTHELIDDLNESQATQEYVNAFPTAIKQYIAEHIRAFTSGNAVFLNHSMGDKQDGEPTPNNTTLDALKTIWYEASKQLDDAAQERFDAFLPAIGNGSSVTGPCRAMKRDNTTRVAGYETVQSAAAYAKKHPGLFERRFGIKPGQLKRHNLPGTSYTNNKDDARFDDIDFPHLDEAVQRHLDDIILISGAAMDKEYEEKEGSIEEMTRSLPHWDEVPQTGDLGRSTRAGIAAALSDAQTYGGGDYLVIAYDSAGRYDSNK